jgi:hypothetical protein
MKWIGQHIWDFISRFRSDVYFENLSTTTETSALVVDSDGKVSKNVTSGVNMTNGADNRIVTAVGTNGLNAEANFTFNGFNAEISSTGNGPAINLRTSSTTASHNPSLNFVSDDTTGSDNDELGLIQWSGYDAGGGIHVYADIEGSIASAAAGSEAGKLKFNVAENDGTLTTGLKIEGQASDDGEVDVTIGAGTGSTTTIAGGFSAEGTGLVYGSSILTMLSATSEVPKINLMNTNTDAEAPMLQFFKLPTGADDDEIGEIIFFGDDDGDNALTYATFKAYIADASNNDEAGKIEMKVATNSTEIQNAFTATGLGTGSRVDINLGHGAASTTTIAGNLDIDGDTITSAGNFTLDTAGHIGLDVHTDKDIFFKENNTERFKFHMDATPTMEVTGNFTLESSGASIIKSGKNMIDTEYDFHSSTFENEYNDDQASGVILKYSPGADESPAGSELFFLHTDGTWNQTDADAVATGASQLLAVGRGASARVDGVLLKGFVRVASTEILNTPLAVDGLPVYVSTTPGHFDFTAPSGSGDFVRIVGYAIDQHGGDVLIYFDPDKTWIEIA